MRNAMGLAAGERPVDRKSAAHGEAGYERSAHDAYFTEGWVTRALLQAVEFAPEGKSRRETVIWEPACGGGHMARELEAAGYGVCSSDIAGWGYGVEGVDFLDAAATGLSGVPALDAIVTNPPFDQSVLFVARALQLTEAGRGKVAVVQRHDWDAAAERHALFGGYPFRCKLVLPRRPFWIIPPADMPPSTEAARLAPIPVNPKTGKPDSPRFPYAWFLWDWASQGPEATRYLPDPDKTPNAVGRLL